MQVQEIMTKSVECCTPEQSARMAAQLMREGDCGALPVVDNEDDPKVVGIVTDRDLCMGVVAAGRDPNQTRVWQCMTTQVVTCRPDDDVDSIANLMAGKQIRRIPVVDSEGSILGVVSLADLAQESADSSQVANTLHDISEPTPEPSTPRAQDKPE